jgi:malate synthase
MTKRLDRAGLQVDAVLARFLEDEALPGTGDRRRPSGTGLAGLLADFAPKNRALLAKRDDLQAKIDAWHIARRGQPHDHAAYKAFLAEIGYLLPEGPAFRSRRQRRPRGRQGARPAAGGAGHERPLRAERRQCPLGQPV